MFEILDKNVDGWFYAQCTDAKAAARPFFNDQFFIKMFLLAGEEHSGKEEV